MHGTADGGVPVPEQQAARAEEARRIAALLLLIHINVCALQKGHKSQTRT